MTTTSFIPAIISMAFISSCWGAGNTYRPKIYIPNSTNNQWYIIIVKQPDFQHPNKLPDIINFQDNNVVIVYCNYASTRFEPSFWLGGPLSAQVIPESKIKLFYRFGYGISTYNINTNISSSKDTEGYAIFYGDQEKTGVDVEKYIKEKGLF